MVRLLCPSKYYGVIFLVHIDIPIHMSKGGVLWLQSSVFLPRLENGHIRGVLSNSRHSDSGLEGARGPGPCTSGGGLARLLGIRRRNRSGRGLARRIRVRRWAG